MCPPKIVQKDCPNFLDYVIFIRKRRLTIVTTETSPSHFNPVKLTNSHYGWYILTKNDLILTCDWEFLQSVVRIFLTCLRLKNFKYGHVILIAPLTCTFLCQIAPVWDENSFYPYIIDRKGGNKTSQECRKSKASMTVHKNCGVDKIVWKSLLISFIEEKLKSEGKFRICTVPNACRHF